MHPERWSNEDMSELERQLLEAARSERVPDVLSARMADALQVSAGGAATGATAGKVGATLFGKTGLWGALSLGVVAVTAGWAATHTAPMQEAGAPASPQVEQPTQPPGFEATATPKVRSEGPTSPARVPDVAHDDPSAQVAKAAVLDDAALRAEVALLARARQALQAQQVERGLRLLDQHHMRFAGGTLVPEAAALRVEALMQGGSLELAEAKRQQFMKAYPSHPLRAHVASLAPSPASAPAPERVSDP